MRRQRESSWMGGMVCLRPQRKGFPTGGWVERGRRYTVTGPIRWFMAFFCKQKVLIIVMNQNYIIQLAPHFIPELE